MWVWECGRVEKVALVREEGLRSDGITETGRMYCRR